MRMAGSGYDSRKGALLLLLPGAVGVAAIIVPGGMPPLALAACVSVVTAASAWWAIRLCDARHRNVAQSVCAQYLDGLEPLCTGVLPIWSGQIEMARSQTEQGINDLAARFANLSQRLQSAVAASQGNAGGDGSTKGVVALLNDSQAVHHSIIASLRSALIRADFMSGMGKVSGKFVIILNIPTCCRSMRWRRWPGLCRRSRGCVGTIQ
jgi:hypothetical protein